MPEMAASRVCGEIIIVINGGGDSGKGCGDSGRGTTDESLDHPSPNLESSVFQKISDGKFDPKSEIRLYFGLIIYYNTDNGSTKPQFLRT